MKPPAVSLENILELGTPCLRMEIPHAWADINGHMNMRWYVAVFDDAGDELHLRLGLTPEAKAPHSAGTFDLEHHTHFLQEVLPGDTVAVYARMTGCSAKRMSYVMFLVNETRGNVAALFECVNGLVDLRVRKTMAYPEEIAASIQAMVANHGRLEWTSPVCGVMSA